MNPSTQTARSVSVIIPVHNAEDTLEQSLHSVFDQTLPPGEIIVIDDGSTDGSEDVIRRYEGRVAHVRQRNLGQGAARNAGLRRAGGQYVAFLDADDYWRSEFLAQCVAFLEAHPETVAVSTRLIIRGPDGNEQIHPPLLGGDLGTMKPSVLEHFFEFWAAHDHVRTGSVLVRRAVIEKAGYQRADLRVSQDLEYWAYLATFGQWGFLPTPLWIGNSQAAAARAGWMERYRKRRRLCPTVEQWQERVLPRLKPDELAPFSVVRGRVAAGFAQNMVLAGRRHDAAGIVLQYGAAMPHNRLTRLMQTGLALGHGTWGLVCRLILLREFLKSGRLRRRHRRKRAS